MTLSLSPAGARPYCIATLNETHKTLPNTITSDHANWADARLLRWAGGYAGGAWLAALRRGLSPPG